MNKHKHPEIYQKNILNRNYFEGWYYKQVTEDGKHTISFIPGVSFSNNRAHSFIQCLHLDDTGALEAYNIDYPIESFETNDAPFSVSIDSSTFSLEGFSLNLQSENLKVSGQIGFDGITPIETSLLNPNIMGFFSYIPFMECNHGLLSMNHSLSGQLNINGNIINFDGGKGYLEKDWGKSFPKQYVWIQSNHFGDDPVSFFFSMAIIPFIGLSFNGFICNLHIDGKEYRFATYKGTKLKVITFTDERITVKLTNRDVSLLIEGESNIAKELIAPKHGAMDKIIKEVLSGKVSLKLSELNGNIIYEGTSYQSGMELVKELKRSRE